MYNAATPITSNQQVTLTSKHIYNQVITTLINDSSGLQVKQVRQCALKTMIIRQIITTHSFGNVHKMQVLNKMCIYHLTSLCSSLKKNITNNFLYFNDDIFVYFVYIYAFQFKMLVVDLINYIINSLSFLYTVIKLFKETVIKPRAPLISIYLNWFHKKCI